MEARNPEVKVGSAEAKAESAEARNPEEKEERKEEERKVVAREEEKKVDAREEERKVDAREAGARRAVNVVGGAVEEEGGRSPTLEEEVVKERG